MHEVLIDSGVEEFAASLVDGGRVVPGLRVDADGRARSWWWPLPAATDRSALARLLPNGSVEAQHSLAAALEEATDRAVRSRLADAEVALLSPRAGRRAVPDAWIRSLQSPDPWLSPSLPSDRVRGLAADIAIWVASGATTPGGVRLCLRVVEPEQSKPDAGWTIELLVQDPVDSALIVAINELFTGSGLFAAAALEDALRALGTAVRIAPELAPALDQAVPTVVEFDSSGVVAFVRERLAPLAEAGIATLLPHWWAGGPRLGLKAKATSSSTSESGEGGAGFGFEDIVEFSWRAALGGEELTNEELATLAVAAAAKQYLVRFRGQWIEIDPAQVEALLARVNSTEEATAGELIRAGLGLHDLAVDDIEVVSVEAIGWVGDILDATIGGQVEPVVAPPGFAGALRPYQQRGVGWLTFLGRLGLGACLADDMGLGKTAQLIGAMLADRRDGPTLVVCPVSVLSNWQREIARFAPELTVQIHHGSDRRRDDPEQFVAEATDHDVTLTTYGLLHRDRDLLGAMSWARVALDEAQQIKNSSTKVARAARGLKAEQRVALTGTPVENHLGELWSLMQFLNPGLLGSAQSFRLRFARPIELDHNPEATARLARVTQPFVLRRLKSDRSIISDLPDKIETVDSCPLTKEQVSLYQSVVDDLLARAEETEGIERRGLVLAGIMKLKQVCNHPAHFLGDGSGLAGRAGKLRRVEELLGEILAAGDKVLCFTQFTAWGERLGPYLTAKFGVESLWLHGGVNRSKRDEMVDRFAATDGPPLLLLSLKAGGTGLNLTVASHVIHYDRWWNPAVEDQATDRAYRIGQRRNVHVHKLVSAGSIEERIDSLIVAKRDLAARVVGGGESWLTELDTAELAEVLALSTKADD